LEYQAFIQEIESRRIPPVVFLFGEEVYYIDAILNKLIGTCTDMSTRDFNCDILQSEQVNGESVVTLASSFPMMSDRRLVALKSIQKLTESDRKRLSVYIEKPLASTCLVLTANQIDRRKRFYAFLVKNSQWVECKPLYPNQAADWVVQQYMNRNMNISHEGAACLVQQVGTSLWNLQNEIEKMITCNWGTKKFSIEEVASLAGSSRKFNTWELVDAVGRREYRNAMDILKHMMGEGQSSVGLIVALSQRIFLLLKIQHLKKQGFRQPQIMKTLALRSYFANLYIDQASRFTTKELEYAQRVLLQTDVDIKTGRQKPMMAMTLLIHAIVRCSANQLLKNLTFDPSRKIGTF
jgi:DNA polymerase-3 subunit delta